MDFNLEKDLIPLSKFRNSYKKYIASLTEEKRSIVLTQNGKAAAILISPQEYDSLQKLQTKLREMKFDTDQNSARLERLRNSPLIGCQEADPELSTDYKKHLNQLMQDKHGNS